jgi:hypothetical protein
MAAFNEPIVVDPNSAPAATILPEVLILCAVMSPQVNDELVVFPVIILPEELSIKKLLFPDDGLVMFAD